MIKFIVILFFSFVCQSWGCKLMKNTQDIYTCDSWEEFTKAGSHPEWKKLMLKNIANLEKVPLKNGAFKSVPNLENLYIEGLVNKVESGVFKDLPNLKKLHLVENVIEELPEGIFSGLNINLLEIKNSQLKKITPGIFELIEFVNLEGNQISPGTTFKNANMVQLGLSHNSILKLEDCAFCGMNKVTHINLQENSLTSFDPIRILGEKSPIMGVALEGNKLTEIPKFDSFPNLFGISVGNNSIDNIEDNCFANNPKFSLLDVSNNKLKDIPANILPEFTNEKSPFFLIIHGNQIQCLSKELRDKIKVLGRVTVNDNPWKCECLDDVIAWAKDKNSWVGCEIPESECKITCVDKDKKEQIVTLYDN